tara:strand:+ start:1033 stop:1314 length:282 start_codon:yes stop_codon:yes gene_type:complete
MDKKNILSEDIISSFFKGLFKGMKQGIFGKKTKSSEQAKKELQNSVDKLNSGLQGMANAVNNYRTRSGQKPIKRKQKKYTVKDITDLYGKGKL